MFLKYLEIEGFKSFPDKVKIEFDMGITGIVGPNGSGKSNISDAIRWVLGEQSIKSLRGGKMEDVIFSGTAERKPTGFSEVSICFDNSDKLLKIDYNEVIITRRYFRSGESEYYINKSSCRLKDVHELLMDTGMGRDGYSVVGQGKIDEMISSKPEDRRVIFEEAAGISKYRYRKAESERKMQQTGENLVRLLDLLSEIELRLEPLKKDSEKAKKYLSLREQLRDVEISVSLDSLDNLKKALEKLYSDLKNNGQDIINAEQKIQNIEKELEICNEKSKESELIQEEKVRLLYELKNKIASLENDVSLLTSSKSYNVENTDRLSKEIAQLEQSIKEQNDIISQNDKSKASVTSKIDAIAVVLEAKKKEFNKIDTGIEYANNEIEKLNQQTMQLMQELSECKSQISAINAANESLIQQKKSAVFDIEIAQEDIEINTKRYNQEQEKLEQLNKTVKNNDEIINKYETGKYETDNKISSISETISDITINIEQLSSKLKVLSDMERDMEGYAHSVKSVIKESEHGELKELKIFGTLSKVISVDSKYSTAVEAALGNNLQNIVTQTQNDAKKAIEYLKKTKGGRATFLPIDSIDGKKLRTDEFENEKGYISLLSDVISCDKRFRCIVDDALGRTILIDTIDNAIAFSKKFKYKFKLATIEGEIFNAGGSVTGGNLNKNFSFLSRKVQIEELDKQILKLENEKNALSSQKSELNSELEKLVAEYNKVCEQQQLSKNEIIKTEINVNHYKEICNELNDKLQEYTDNSLKFDTIINENNKKISEYNEKSNKAQINIENIKFQTQSIQDKNTESNKLTKELNNEIIKLTIEMSDYESNRSIFEQNISNAKTSVAVAKSQIDKKNGEIDTSASQDTEIITKIENVRKKIEEENEKSVVFDLEIQNVKKDREELAIKKENLSAESKIANETLLMLSQEKIRIENKISKSENETESINSKLWDDYELTYITAQQYRKPIENFAEMQKQVNAHKQAIKALGNINVGAIDEYSTTKERYDFLLNQKNDLEKAKNDLNEIIDDMEKLMVKQFSEQLHIINQTFSNIFKELFNGGDAELVLTDDKNILECGVEIHAQPPGKKLQNMTLFSGGEKAIIAIALLFALLQVRPSPLCVLDEIEAALDDVNVYRFASYLRKISQKSQIAIITHRRGTMELADVLYGVTMQEKGVSKLLPLNINEIEEKILK